METTQRGQPEGESTSGRAGTDAAEALARRLSTRARKSGNGWLTRCPGHNDRHPSLHIAPAPDRETGFLAHCFAGCGHEVLERILREYASEDAPGKESGHARATPGREGTGAGERGAPR